MRNKSVSVINILCSLSKVLCGNRDVIEYIYRKKKMIEKNETMLYYLYIGLQSEGSIVILSILFGRQLLFFMKHYLLL